MKQILLISLLTAALAAPAGRSQDGKHLFILSGQSNMARLDPSRSFIPAVTEEFGGSEVIVVKDAEGGQPIRRWYKRWRSAAGDTSPSAGDLYDRLMRKVNAAVDTSAIQTVTFVWMQGERDAREQHGTVYAASLHGLLAQLRSDLGRSDINIVIGRLSDFDITNERYPHWTMVRRAHVQVAASSPRIRWVNTDDLNGVNDALHYTKRGYEILGQRFAEAAIELVQSTPDAPGGQRQISELP